MNARNLACAAVFSLLSAASTALAQMPPAPPVAQAAPPWMKTSLSPDARAELLQAQMTLSEELTLVRGYPGMDYSWIRNPLPPALRADLPGSAGYVPGIPRLGIPAQRETDASLGVANGRHMRPGDQATALPSSLLTAATWNPEIAYAGGAMIGAEARAKGFNVMLAGGVDLARDPRNGRTFEYAGEDPLLAGVMVGESIRGIQSQHIVSTAKHFALNDQETGRMYMSADISEAAMRESDLLAFEIAIEHGNPGSIMCAYNRVNSVYSCENDYLLNQVLKQDWAYRGYVMSDWGAVHSTADAANHGLDQESASSIDREDYFADGLRQAVTDGTVPVARLHNMVHRILRSMFAHGLFDYPLVKQPIDVQANLDVAQRNAEEGIVLLKNSTGLLPLTAKVRSIALIGGRADTGVYSGSGSSQVIPIGNDPSQEILAGGAILTPLGEPVRIPSDTIVLDPPSPLAMIRAEAPRARVQYIDGDNIDQAVALARHSEVAIVFAHQWMREGLDVFDLSLYGNQNALIEAVAAANPRTIVVLETGGPVMMPWIDKVGTVLEAWYPGNRGATAIARILFGEVNPSGRLPITFPLSDSQLPRPVITGSYNVGQKINPVGTPTLFDVIYTEEANVGYKWFQAGKITPLFPFGFGLSYTTFSYDGLKVAGSKTLSVSFDVHNTGTRQGKATAQVYAKTPYGGPRLIGWSKVDLQPGETRHVTLTADPRLLALFDPDANNWRVEEGDYTVMLGGSSAEISATATAHVAASTIKP